MNKFWGLVTVAVVIGLSGCAGQVKPQSPPPVVEKPPVVPVQKAPEQPVPPPVVQPAVPQTQPPAPAPSNNAVTSLVDQARSQYQAKNYQSAIATAERALRIDRRSSEAYLVLAQSYLQQANPQLAKQFIQQGIRYAQAGSELAQTLLQLRDSVSQ